jgi:hypothetical protein
MKIEMTSSICPISLSSFLISYFRNRSIHQCWDLQSNASRPVSKSFCIPFLFLCSMIYRFLRLYMVLIAFTTTRQHGPSSCYVERRSFENLSVLMDDKKISMICLLVTMTLASQCLSFYKPRK